jgi:predicted dehydrogenase
VRWLIVGAGSIGLQHLAALKAIGEHDLCVVEPNLERRKAAWVHVGKRHAFGELAEIDRCDVVIVATPTALHVDHAIAAAKVCKTVIIEKPVSHDLTRQKELTDALASTVTAVACPMRFHPRIIEVAKLVTDQTLGNVYRARQWYRQHMREWRPGTDHRESYSAKRATGGGLLLDRIHELDTARALFGLPAKLICTIAGTLEPLEVEVEHIVDMLSLHGGVSVTTELDCISPGYTCGIQVAGTKGQVAFELDLPGWEHAKLGQAAHWRDVASGASEPLQSLQDAFNVLNVAMAAYHAANSANWITFTNEKPVEAA